MALTLGDFDFEAQAVEINKNYARLDREDLILEPKTPKSNRRVSLPTHVCELVKDYANRLVDYEDGERLFEVTKGFLYHEMERGCKKSGVKRIRVHDVRHPYVKHTTKKYNSEKQKTQATKMDLIAWGFCFCIVSYSKRSWTL